MLCNQEYANTSFEYLTLKTYLILLDSFWFITNATFMVLKESTYVENQCGVKDDSISASVLSLLQFPVTTAHQ